MGEIGVVNKISKRVSEITVDDIARYCEEAGVTVESLCVKLKELMGAGKEIRDRDGERTGVKEPDWNVQYKAMVVGLELLKLVKKDVEIVGMGQVEHKMAAGDIERLEAIARELRGLERRLVEDSVQRGEVEAA